MQSENPYASPVSSGADAFNSVGADPIRLASQGQRFVNLIIDSIVTYVLSMFAGAFIGFMYVIMNGVTAITPDVEGMLNLMGAVAGLLSGAAYYAIMEGAFQRTIGKLITGTRVVRTDGDRPKAGQIIGRSFARYIPFEAFSFFGGNGYPVGWHDSLSGTRVVRTR